MAEFTKVKSNASSSVLYSLHVILKLDTAEAIHEAIAIVQPTCDELAWIRVTRQSCDRYFLIPLRLCNPELHTLF